MLDGWIWPHVTTCWHAVPLMIRQRSGLLVEIIEQEGIGSHGQFYFDLFEILLKRLSYNLAEELVPHRVTAVAIAPGFMRTEAILEQFGVAEANWRDAAENNAQAKSYGFAGSETPCFVGRAIAALAADPHLLRKSGGIYTSWGLSEEYGFPDVDGARPNMGRYMAEHFPNLMQGSSNSGRQWQLCCTAAPAKARAQSAVPS